MKLRINFFAEPSGPNVAPSSIANSTGDFDTLEDARKIALSYAENPTIRAHSVLFESDDRTISERWVRDGAGWRPEDAPRSQSRDWFGKAEIAALC
jgi:hypothetical protein